MTLQISIRKISAKAEDFFHSAHLYEFAESEISLGGEACDLSIPEANATVLRIFCKENLYFLELLDATYDCDLRGQKLSAGQAFPLFSGDSLSLAGYQISFYLRYAKAHLSKFCAFSASFVKFSLLIIFLLQVLCLLSLPFLIKHKSIWYGQQMRLDIISQIDKLREIASFDDNSDLLAQVLLKSYQTELKQRIVYVRENSEKLSRKQRKKMLAANARLEERLLHLHEAKLLQDFPSIEIEIAVKKILEASTYD